MAQNALSVSVALMALICGAAVPASDTEPVSLPNPAAVFCEDQGGTHKIVQEAAGARGLCVLPDGEEVDAWAFFEAGREADPKK